MPIIPDKWILRLPLGTSMIIGELAEHGTAVCFDDPVNETLSIKVSDHKGEVKTFTLTKQMTDSPHIMQSLTKELRDMRDHLDTLDFSAHKPPIDPSIDISDYVEHYLKLSLDKTSLVRNTLNANINIPPTEKIQNINEALYEAIKNRGDFDIDFDKLVDVMMSLGVLKPKE